MPQDRPFCNSNLFSNHYLENLIQKSPEWSWVEGMDEAFQRIKELFDKKIGIVGRYSESELEDAFIRPILRILGHHYAVQEKISARRDTPDYGFFPDQKSVDEAYALKGTSDFYLTAVAIGDAKRWKTPLTRVQLDAMWTYVGHKGEKVVIPKSLIAGASGEAQP